MDGRAKKTRNAVWSVGNGRRGTGRKCPPGLHPWDGPVVGVAAEDEGSQLRQRSGQWTGAVGHHHQPEAGPGRCSRQFACGKVLRGNEAVGRGSTDDECWQTRPSRQPEIGSTELPGKRGHAGSRMCAPPRPLWTLAGGKPRDQRQCGLRRRGRGWRPRPRISCQGTARQLRKAGTCGQLAHCVVSVMATCQGAAREEREITR
jgi:hypothetical protein